LELHTELAVFLLEAVVADITITTDMVALAVLAAQAAVVQAQTQRRDKEVMER